MVKIVILGSCRFEPYEVLFVPKKGEGRWHTDEGYKKATERCYPAIQQADEVWIYAPDGLGEHTRKDIEFAKKSRKIVRIIGEEGQMCRQI